MLQTSGMFDGGDLLRTLLPFILLGVHLIASACQDLMEAELFSRIAASETEEGLVSSAVS